MFTLQAHHTGTGHGPGIADTALSNADASPDFIFQHMFKPFYSSRLKIHCVFLSQSNPCGTVSFYPLAKVLNI